MHIGSELPTPLPLIRTATCCRWESFAGLNTYHIDITLKKENWVRICCSWHICCKHSHMMVFSCFRGSEDAFDTIDTHYWVLRVFKATKRRWKRPRHCAHIQRWVPWSGTPTCHCSPGSCASQNFSTLTNRHSSGQTTISSFCEFFAQSFFIFLIKSILKMHRLKYLLIYFLLLIIIEIRRIYRLFIATRKSLCFQHDIVKFLVFLSANIMMNFDWKK